MLLGNYFIDKTFDEHVRDIADLASDPQTLIFFDTNILSYLYKLHEAARSEFFVWSDTVLNSNRLVIPAWAANEYLSRVTTRTLNTYTPKSKEHAQATKLLNSLFETASLFVDEASLRRINFGSDRAKFITGFRSAIDALTPFTSVFSQEFDSGVIHQQIESRLSPAILDSDLAALCARATQEGPGRFEHRLPPGFRDADKPENRLGDLIIWFEILAKSSTSKEAFSKVLFITRDEKSDWVYAPSMRTEIVRGNRKPVNNARPEIKIADPRLITEFRRATNHSNLAIASFDTLVEGLSKANPALFTHLAAAIQINIELSVPAPIATFEEPEPLIVEQALAVPVAPQPAEEMQPQPVEADQPNLVYEQAALRDREYQADAPSLINEIIRDLKSLNWYTQNPAIVRISSIRDEFSPSSWFVLGRNVYQAACGNSQKAMEYIAGLESQLRQFPLATAKHLLAGMLFEIYFDSRGDFRTRIKFSYADKPLALAAHQDYSDVAEFMNYHLRNHREHLAFIPGDSANKVIRITSTPLEPAGDAPQPQDGVPNKEIRSVQLDGVELLSVHAEGDRAAGVRRFGHKFITADNIRDRLSDSLAIPKWALTIETEPAISADEYLAIPEGHGIQPSLAL